MVRLALFAVCCIAMVVSTVKACAPVPPPTYREYDSERSRRLQLIDGLGINVRIINKISFFGSRINRLIREAPLISSALHLATLNDSATNQVSSAVRDDICDYLQMQFNSEFTCSEQQLSELSFFIKSYLYARELRKFFLDMEGDEACIDFIYDCAYWNSHVLQNCSVYDQVSLGSGASGNGSDGGVVEHLANIQTSILELEVGGKHRDCFCPVPDDISSPRT